MTVTTDTKPWNAASGDTLMTVLAAAQDARITPLLWGEPGVGKSSGVRAWAEQTGRDFFQVLGSLREPTDFAGLPIVHGDTHLLSSPNWARAANEAEDGAVVLLDEATTCSPATQAAMLGAVLDRVVGDTVLAPHVTVIAAANPADMAAGGYDLTPPMANRFLHIVYAPDAEDWISGMVAGWPLPTARTVHAATVERQARAITLVTGFIRTSPELLQQMPAPDATGQAWPSHRTWEMVTRMLARLDETDTEAIQVAVTGLVGPGAAAEFLTYLQAVDLPDPAEVMADPSSVDWAAMRSDQMWRALTGVMTLTAARGTAEAWRAAWVVLAAAAQAHGDTSPAAAHARQLSAIKPTGTVTPPREARALVTSLEAAGLWGAQ